MIGPPAAALQRPVRNIRLDPSPHVIRNSLTDRGAQSTTDPGRKLGTSTPGLCLPNPTGTAARCYSRRGGAGRAGNEAEGHAHRQGSDRRQGVRIAGRARPPGRPAVQPMARPRGAAVGLYAVAGPPSRLTGPHTAPLTCFDAPNTRKSPLAPHSTRSASGRTCIVDPKLCQGRPSPTAVDDRSGRSREHSAATGDPSRCTKRLGEVPDQGTDATRFH